MRRLPELPLNPPEPSHECNKCGALFDLPHGSRRRRAAEHEEFDEDNECPECESTDIHRT